MSKLPSGTTNPLPRQRDLFLEQNFSCSAVLHYTALVGWSHITQKISSKPICIRPKQFLLPSKIISRHRVQFKGLITSPLVNQRERGKEKEKETFRGKERGSESRLSYSYRSWYHIKNPSYPAILLPPLLSWIEYIIDSSFDMFASLLNLPYYKLS